MRKQITRAVGMFMLPIAVILILLLPDHTGLTEFGSASEVVALAIVILVIFICSAIALTISIDNSDREF